MHTHPTHMQPTHKQTPNTHDLEQGLHAVDTLRATYLIARVFNFSNTSTMACGSTFRRTM